LKNFLRRNVEHVLTVVSIISTLVLSIYIYYNSTLPGRTNFSILVDTESDANWYFNDNGATFSVNLSLCNEGPRKALVKSLELSVIYELESGDQYMLTSVFSNFTRFWGKPNDPMVEDEMRGFLLVMNISRHIYVDEVTGQVIDIGESPSQKFKVLVRFDDGLEPILIAERTFDYAQ
jgi:hypothetical protein